MKKLSSRAKRGGGSGRAQIGEDGSIGPKAFLERTSDRSDRATGGEPPPRIWARFSAAALRGNYKAIQELAGEQHLLPMIKANAYGHGAEWAARILVDLPGLYGLGVATLPEGEQIRRAIGPRYRTTKILVFSGISPWTEEKGHYCLKHGLVPVIASDDDWYAFVRGGWMGKLPYELKFNTGMNRLGMSVGLTSHVVKTLRDKPTMAHPEGVLSHLAMGEDADSKLSRMQAEMFRALRSQLAPVFPAAHFHLANSAAIWNRKAWGMDGLTDVVRPGLSLYGVVPWAGAPSRGIEPVAALEAAVMLVRQLKRGDSIGYGGTYTVTEQMLRENGGSIRAAVVSAGYADGLSRGLSNKGYAWVGGQAGRFLGIVSMDLSAVSCPASTQPGDPVQILGPQVDIWAQARAAGTIPYELLTSLSARVQRIYE